MATVLLAEATPIVRYALRGIVEELGHQIVGEAADVPPALALVRSNAPDLVILDLALPGVGGMDLLRRIKSRNERQRVLVYSRQSAEQFAPLCFQAGANGFVSKDEEVASLRKAIIDVLAGRAFFSREHMLPGSGNELERLTPRELAVLQLLAEGNSNLHIAEQLLISFKTVSTYKKRLQEKLRAGSTVELADIARRNGLVPGEIVAEVPQGEVGLLRKLVDASPNPMFMRDKDGLLQFCNQRFLDYYHLTAEEAVGSPLADARWFPQEIRERLPESFRQRVRAGEPAAETTYLTVAGEQRCVYLWIVPYRDESGQVVGLFGGLQDITESEQQLLELRDRLLAAESQASRLLEGWEACVEEVTQLLGGLGLHPATPGLATLSERLQRLRRTCDLQYGPLPMVPEPCDLLVLLTRLLEVRPSTQLVVLRKDATRVWLDIRAFHEWLGVAVGLFSSQEVMSTELAMQLSRRGYLLMRIRMSGLAAPISVINLIHCRRLAEQLDGVFRHAGERERLEVEFELELPLASVS